MTTQKQKQFVMTPVGLAEYPFLSTADTKYKPEGEYKVKMKFDKNDAEAQHLFKALTLMGNQAYDEALAKATAAGKRPPKRAELPMYDNGSQFVLTAKLMASGVNKTTKQVFHQAPRLFDADNTPWDKTKLITHGSKLRICAEVVGYDSPATGAGITLRLKDVQVKVLGAGFNTESPFGPVAKEEPPAFGAVNQMSGGSDDDGDF